MDKSHHRRKRNIECNRQSRNINPSSQRKKKGNTKVGARRAGRMKGMQGGLLTNRTRVTEMQKGNKALKISRKKQKVRAKRGERRRTGKRLSKKPCSRRTMRTNEETENNLDLSEHELTDVSLNRTVREAGEDELVVPDLVSLSESSHTRPVELSEDQEELVRNRREVEDDLETPLPPLQKNAFQRSTEAPNTAGQTSPDFFISKGHKQYGKHAFGLTCLQKPDMAWPYPDINMAVWDMVCSLCTYHLGEQSVCEQVCQCSKDPDQKLIHQGGRLDRSIRNIEKEKPKGRGKGRGRGRKRARGIF